MNEQDKYLISSGLSLNELYQSNPDILDEIVTQTNKNLNLDNLDLEELTYFASASTSESMNIPAQSYLVVFSQGDKSIRALVTATKKVTLLDDSFVVPAGATTSEQSPNTNPSSTPDTSTSSTNTPTTTTTGQDATASNNQTSTPATPTSQFQGLDIATLNTTYNSIKTTIVDKYDKQSSKQMTDAYQDYLLKNGSYPEASTSEMALLDTNTQFYWVPIVTPDKNSVFWVASFNSSDTGKVSTTLVCIDGKYYQFVDTSANSSSVTTIAINDDGSDYSTIIKAANLGDKYYLDNKQTQYWVRVK